MGMVVEGIFGYNIIYGDVVGFFVIVWLDGEFFIFFCVIYMVVIVIFYFI